MKFRTLGFCLLVPTATFAIACGGNSDANKANVDMSAPSHDNMTPGTDGGVNSDLAAPAKVNESPSPTK